ncbi:MAG: hypothetical protein HY094_07700 [Candidatus Melainabacteria bacterium]|nr:hypothetical protein [Candidatus Melainabacteria bacterium]
MGSLAVKLGTAVLAGVIPFGAAGCKGKQEMQETAQVQKVKHFSEIFPFKRDENTGKVFVGKEEKKFLIIKTNQEHPFYPYDLENLDKWQKLFNQNANKLEQIEINAANILSSLPKHGEQNIIFPNNFYDLSTLDALISKSVCLNMKEEVNLVVFPVASFKDGSRRPLALTLEKSFEFMPNSLAPKFYSYDSHNNLGGYDQVGTGISFKVENKATNLTLNLTAPLENLPLIITTENKMYLIGLDKVDVQKGNLEVSIR